jgi:hypothetical protein
MFGFVVAQYATAIAPQQDQPAQYRRPKKLSFLGRYFQRYHYFKINIRNVSYGSGAKSKGSG